jgi:hypothetical protein
MNLEYIILKVIYQVPGHLARHHIVLLNIMSFCSVLRFIQSAYS